MNVLTIQVLPKPWGNRVSYCNHQLKEKPILVYKEDQEKGIVEIMVDGKLTQEDYNRCLQPLEKMIALHGKIKILEEIRGFSGVEPSGPVGRT